MSETYVTYRVWDGCKAPVNLEYSGRLMGQIVRESTIDRDALLELADEMECDADHLEKHPYSFISPSGFRCYAESIREACGVVD